jgi:hypothetical protein
MEFRWIGFFKKSVTYLVVPEGIARLEWQAAPEELFASVCPASNKLPATPNVRLHSSVEVPLAVFVIKPKVAEKPLARPHLLSHSGRKSGNYLFAPKATERWRRRYFLFSKQLFQYFKHYFLLTFYLFFLFPAYHLYKKMQLVCPCHCVVAVGQRSNLVAI